MPSGRYSAHWHSPYVCPFRVCREKHPALCTDHPTIVGRTPALLLTLTSPRPSLPTRGLHFHHKYPSPNPHRGAQARRLPLLPSAHVGLGSARTTLCRLWTSPGKGFEGAGTRAARAGGNAEQGRRRAGRLPSRWVVGGRPRPRPRCRPGHNPSWIWFPARVTARSRPGRLHLSN